MCTILIVMRDGFSINIVMCVQSSHKEGDVRKHILTNYGASKSGDKKVGSVEGYVLGCNFSVGSPRDRLLAFRDVPEV